MTRSPIEEVLPSAEPRLAMAKTLEDHAGRVDLTEKGIVTW